VFLFILTGKGIWWSHGWFQAKGLADIQTEILGYTNTHDSLSKM